MNNIGARSIVFMIRNRVDFISYNHFENNEGPSIRVSSQCISAYDKDQKLSRHSFSFANSIKLPLIMYRNLSDQI